MLSRLQNYLAFKHIAILRSPASSLIFSPAITQILTTIQSMLCISFHISSLRRAGMKPEPIQCLKWQFAGMVRKQAFPQKNGCGYLYHSDMYIDIVSLCRSF